MPASKDKYARRPRGKPNDIDAHVGRRIHQRRLLLGMSQTALADEVGVTFQQVQKYERGANRVGAGRLFQIARTLDVPVGYFFEGIEGAASAEGSEGAGAPRAAGGDILASRETMVLVRAYYAIPSAEVRRRLTDLMRSLAESVERQGGTDNKEQPGGG